MGAEVFAVSLAYQTSVSLDTQALSHHGAEGSPAATTAHY